MATATGLLAVALWSLLALATVATAPVPPLQLNAMGFAMGTAVGLVWTAAAGGLERLRGLSLGVLAFGTAGLFGYHLLYFTALRLAPPAEAGLVAYLWPLMIVLLSGLLPGERLRAGHLAGAGLGFLGAALLLGGGVSGDGSAWPGYAAALACALVWSSYSVGSRMLGAVPTSSVTAFCGASAVLSLGLHLALEETAWPEGALGWGAVLGLGLGPVGLAFYAWDVGVKRGDIQALGAASYAAPVLSTMALVATGLAEPGRRLALATALVTGGAVLAARAGAPRRA
jgi:drug/metabolite transporter (DMT)-like permease